MAIFKQYLQLFLECPECGSKLKLWKNWGIESMITGTCPYYCLTCKTNKKDYVIFNVTTRRNELIYAGAFCLIMVCFVLLYLVRGAA